MTEEDLLPANIFLTPGSAAAFGGICFYEITLAEEAAGGSTTGATNPFIYTPAEGFKQPQTFEISIPRLLTERSRKMKNPWNGGTLIYTLPAIFQGCYIAVRNHLQALHSAVALRLFPQTLPFSPHCGLK